MVCRDRPATIQIEVKSIDDTSNFDEFPDIDLKWRKFNCSVVLCISQYTQISVTAVFHVKWLLFDLDRYNNDHFTPVHPQLKTAGFCRNKVLLPACSGLGRRHSTVLHPEHLCN